MKITKDDDNVVTETNTKYAVFDATGADDSRNMEYYTGRYGRNVSRKKYNRQRYNRFTKSGVSRRRMQGKYKVTSAIVELVDIFPTIADLAGVPIPMCQIHRGDYELSNLTRLKEVVTCSEGVTLLPLVKSAVRHQVKRPDLRYRILLKSTKIYRVK